MRIVLSNIGTLGDIYPLLALAVELQRHSHQPVVAVSPAFEAQVKRAGLAFAPIGPDIQTVLQALIKERVAMAEFLTSAEAIHHFFAPVAAALPQMFADLMAVCRQAELIVAGATQPVGRMVHELTGLPYVSIFLAPPGAGTEPKLQQARLRMINSIRQTVGLPGLPDPATAFASPQLTLYALSRHVIPRPATWPAHYHLTGYFYFDQSDWEPEPQLVEFLAGGEAPIVFSFGSMTHEDPALLTELLLEAIHRVGCRALIQQGWSGLAQQTLPANVYALGFASHDWLFPRAACVIHHGGTGTGGAVFRAGVPQVIVPHLADQPLWAAITQDLGCAGPGFPYSQLTAERLSQAITATLTVPGYRQAAAALGEKVRAESGVRKARALIEALGLADSSLDENDLPARVGKRKQLQQLQRLRRA